MQERILVTVAHPDDAELLLGGTLIVKARQGASIRIAAATNGAWGSLSIPPEELIPIRRAEAERAATHYGGEVHFLGPGGSGYRDGSLGACDFDMLCEEIVYQIREFRATCVATFNPRVFDAHPDHTAIGRATAAAMLFCDLPNAYAHQAASGLSPHCVSSRILFAVDRTWDNCVFDITTAMDAKIAALLEHESQCTVLVGERAAQAGSAGLDVSWVGADAANGEMVRELIARAARHRARTVTVDRRLGRLRGWLTGCRFAESFWYGPLPPALMDALAEERVLYTLWTILRGKRAERLFWMCVRRIHGLRAS